MSESHLVRAKHRQKFDALQQIPEVWQILYVQIIFHKSFLGSNIVLRK